MKIKYFIFGLLVTVFSVINFSNASNFDSCIEDSDCLSCMCNSFSSSCSNQCDNNVNTCSANCDYSHSECESSCGEDVECLDICNTDYDSCTVSCSDEYDFCDSECQSETESCNDNGDYLESNNDYGQCYSEFLPGGDNTGGDNTGGDNTGGELIGQLSPVITGLSSTVVEIIPYIVYIGLGVLGAILGFVAIKWLINWIRSKVLSPFK